jgi:pimeloyl-ACP methyl ester carboxylesterase
MVLTALAVPARVAALVGIAAAADATEDLMLPRLSEAQRKEMMREGSVRVPSAYDPRGYVYTKRLIEDGRDHLVLRSPIPLRCPVRLLHGMRDPDVPWTVSVKLAERLAGDDVRVVLVKDGDHRLSTDRDLDLLRATLDELLGA